MMTAIAVFCLTASGAEAVEVTSVRTIDGSVMSFKGHSATVLVFLTTECPIARSVQPELKRLHSTFKDKDVQFLGIQIDPTLDKDGVLTYTKEYGIGYSQVIDKRHELVQQFKASVTPEVFVLDSSGKVRYQGKVDDSYKEVGVKRDAKVFYLRNAIEAVLAGKDPSPAKVKAVGCIIPELEDF